MTSASGGTTAVDNTNNWQLSTYVERTAESQETNAAIGLLYRVHSLGTALVTAESCAGVIWADLSYTVSCIRNWLYGVDDLHEIIDNLYLGEQPTHDKSHLKKITELGINSIVAILSEDETRDTAIIVIKESEWKEKNITYKRYNTDDETASTIQIMNEAVDYIKEQLDAKKTVLVHCRKGIGRSAGMVLAFMVKYRGWEPEAAINHATLIRKIINLNTKQRERFIEFANEVKNNGKVMSLADSVIVSG